ncbi:MAG: phosphoribosylaminoimidazolesuccinocarboxamide synthase [Planctomycetota bacterium]
MQTQTAVVATELPGLKFRNRGKVRDIYDLDDNLLIVATDRISAFDCVMPEGIPGKGKILTELSLFWFDLVRDITPNHLITADVAKMGHEIAAHKKVLAGRTMLVKKAEVFPIECVVRGYLAGSGWKEYQKSGTVAGIPLPAGLKQAQQLPEPIFTPATKAATGHDENIDFKRMAAIVGEETARTLRDRAVAVYAKAAAHAREREIIIADTKFEFGVIDGEICLVDEVLTPDSSRFWPMAGYTVGGSPPSYDKQYLRDYLETLDWDKTPPAPHLPEEVITNTLAKYQEALDRLAV